MKRGNQNSIPSPGGRGLRGGGARCFAARSKIRIFTPTLPSPIKGEEKSLHVVVAEDKLESEHELAHGSFLNERTAFAPAIESGYPNGRETTERGV
jgi:hypothetical protein